MSYLWYACYLTQQDKGCHSHIRACWPSTLRRCICKPRCSRPHRKTTPVCEAIILLCVMCYSHLATYFLHNKLLDMVASVLCTLCPSSGLNANIYQFSQIQWWLHWALKSNLKCNRLFINKQTNIYFCLCYDYSLHNLWNCVQKVIPSYNYKGPTRFKSSNNFFRDHFLFCFEDDID